VDAIRMQKMIEENLNNRWIPICEAETCEGMITILDSTKCTFCYEIDGTCKDCPAATKEEPCVNLFARLIAAIDKNDFPAAKAAAMKMRKRIETWRADNV